MSPKSKDDSESGAEREEVPGEREGSETEITATGVCREERSKALVLEGRGRVSATGVELISELEEVGTEWELSLVAHLRVLSRGFLNAPVFEEKESSFFLGKGT